MTNSTTVYVLDNQDRIISVSGAWDEFSKENGGANLYSIDVYGRSIWDFVTGDATRMWLGAVFQYARLRGSSVERPYRCDSPDLKRFMRMRVIPDQTCVLRIEHEILSTEQRIAPVIIKYGSITMKNTKQRCSICGRLQNIGGWQEPHEDHANWPSEIIVIYTVCEDCQRLMPGTS